MDLKDQIDAAREDMIQLLLAEAMQIGKRIDQVDDIRTELLNVILQLGHQYDGVIKQLDLMGHDTSAL